MSTKEDYKMFTACDRAQHTCDKSQYNEATIVEKIKLSIHLLFCKACQKYTANNNKLTKVMKAEKVETFAASEKNKMEDLFQQQLKNSQNK